MACFLVGATEAIIVTVAAKAIKAKEHREEASVGTAAIPPQSLGDTGADANAGDGRVCGDPGMAGAAEVACIIYPGVSEEGREDAGAGLY